MTILLTYRTTIMWTNILRHQIILIARWNYLLLIHLLALPDGDLLSWQVDLLALIAHWRFQNNSLLWIFESCRVIAMVINHVNIFDGLDSVIRIIEVLGRLIEHVNIISILKLFCLLVHLIPKFKVFIKTSPGWASSRISRSLALSFNTLNDFPSLGINSTKRIHATILLMRV